MFIFATKFTVKMVLALLSWILVVALREGYPECFSYLSSFLNYPLKSIVQ
jgi:hypothetical protein